MVPPAFDSFFTAMVGAGATLIGLLFVAIAVNPERTFSRDAPRQRQALATSAYTALANAFLLSAAALIPGDNLGPLALILSVIGLLEGLAVGIQLMRVVAQVEKQWWYIVKVVAFIALAFVIYGIEFTVGLRLFTHPKDPGALLTMSRLVLGINALGTVRAWQLLGARGRGLQGWLLNPLTDLEAAAPTSGTPLAVPPAVARIEEPSREP